MRKCNIDKGTVLIASGIAVLVCILVILAIVFINTDWSYTPETYECPDCEWSGWKDNMTYTTHLDYIPMYTYDSDGNMHITYIYTVEYTYYCPICGHEIDC